MKNKKAYNLNSYKLSDDSSFFRWLLTPFQDMENGEGASGEGELHSSLQYLLANIRVVEKGLSANDKQVMWNKIVREIQVSDLHPSKRRSLWSISAAVAASIVLLFTSYYLYNSYVKTDPAIDYLALLEQSGSEQYSQNIRLITTDKELEIVGDKAELVYENGGVSINAEKMNLAGDTQINQLIVPYGKQSQLLLADGTKIWINSGTKLVYPTSFRKDKREIYVEGEIYLEVAPNEAHPFIVKTNNMAVKVLGTSFNIQSYKDETKQSVVLATGSVEVINEKLAESIVIHPDQIYNYDTKDNESHVKEVDVYDFLCWRFGFFHFKSEKLSVVLHRLQRHYNIPIRYNADEIDKIRVSGKLNLQNSVSETFSSIALTAPILYKIDNEYINVDVKPK